MRLPFRDLALVVFVILVLLVGGVAYPKWRATVDRNQDARADPHHIAGGLYFVGAPDVTSFLLVGDKGHVLIGAGYEGTAHKIVDNIKQLGFDITQVKALIATDPHLDEAGGFAELQRASGAELWASAANADTIALGGKNDPSVVYLPYKVMALTSVTSYPAARVDHRVSDGATTHVGSLTLTAHITPGHAPGCTTWTFMVREKDRDLRVVHRCGLSVPYRASLVEPERPAGVRADFERTFRMLRDLPVDIWLTSQGRRYGRYRKYEASLHSADPVTPFIDPAGYLDSIGTAEAGFRKLLADQSR